LSQTQKYLQEIIDELARALDFLGEKVDKPKQTTLGGVFSTFFRHASGNDILMSYLKCVRSVSTLNASIVLLKEGYIQEVGALCRIVQDNHEDILFISTPLGKDGAFSEDQHRLVQEFFQEEFDQPSNPFKSTQKRDRVPRQTIINSIARMSANPINPSDARELNRTLQQSFSGYVHCAYPHIMEMYEGHTQRYFTNGMPGTPRIPEWEKTLCSFIYRTTLSVELVSKRLSEPELADRLKNISHQLGATFKCVAQGSLDKSLSKIKQGLPLN
jgi:hypothetical protein